MTISIGVLTSGGDAQGMNAAVRAVVRAGALQNARVFAIREGYQGMVDGGDAIREMQWSDTSGILQRGGTVIGTARCPAFRERAGRLSAVRNLLVHGIDRLVVIGGDGSLTGADLFRREWPDLIAELLSTGVIDAALAARHPNLGIVGLVGSIDNDFCGTDMTIGADTALHRITEALDHISSTAASHQRTFVVEVMGRNCGYLALASAIAGGADWVLIPEMPPADGWEDEMCALLLAGRAAGRRESLVIVAEGARDRAGNAISSAYVQKALEQRLHAEARVTILGHIQRGGAPSAYDRWMSTLLGSEAVQELLSASPDEEPKLIGIQHNRIVHAPLMQCVADTKAVPQAIADKDFPRAMQLRGASFDDLLQVFESMARALPSELPAGRRRIAVMQAGAPAPGMNAAVRAAVRLGLQAGHEMLTVRNGFTGLAEGEIVSTAWGDVDGWEPQGGALLGSNRDVPVTDAHFVKISEQLRAHAVDGLLVIGGWSGYEATYALHRVRAKFAACDIPMLCLPCSIDNNLPASELSVGSDTALNVITEAIDKIKRSGMAERHRTFIVEVMGHYCGYLALMAGISTGAEFVYLHETGINVSQLSRDVDRMRIFYAKGNRMSLAIRNERANELYSTPFMTSLFEEEGGDEFDVRYTVLGHMQQGGNPTPDDRVRAAHLAAHAVAFFSEQFAANSRAAMMAGYQQGELELTPLDRFYELGDASFKRPRKQWWLELRKIAAQLS
jgi:6-phosphofructokinase 1